METGKKTNIWQARRTQHIQCLIIWMKNWTICVCAVLFRFQHSCYHRVECPNLKRSTAVNRIHSEWPAHPPSTEMNASLSFFFIFFRSSFCIIYYSKDIAPIACVVFRCLYRVRTRSFCTFDSIHFSSSEYFVVLPIWFFSCLFSMKKICCCCCCSFIEVDVKSRCKVYAKSISTDIRIAGFSLTRIYFPIHLIRNARKIERAKPK